MSAAIAVAAGRARVSRRLARPSHAVRALAAALVAVVLALVARPALAYQPPVIEGHVTDLTGKLSMPDRNALEQRLESERRASGNEIAVLLIPSLGDDTIEDVAYSTFNAWKLGQKGKDNGVLLVLALAEHRVRIETGKGTEGALTDLQASDIIQNDIAPRMKQERYREAIEAGTDAIAAALRQGGVSAPGGQAAQGHVSIWQVVLIVLILLVFIFLRLVFGGGGSSGGGWSSGGGGWSGGGGGFSGGGGSSGGGGASGGW